MAESISVRSIIGVIVVIIVALSLLPVVLTTVATAAATLTGASKTMVELIPLFYIIAVVLANGPFGLGKSVYWAVGTAKK